MDVEQTVNINAEEWAWRKYWKGTGRKTMEGWKSYRESKTFSELFCIDSTIFDTISGNQTQVAISNYSHYVHMDKNIQYNISNSI